MIDHVAELTSVRDRDRLDVALVGAFQDLLAPRSVAIYRPVGEIAEQRWSTRAYLARGDTLALFDPGWTATGALSPFQAHPTRCAAYVEQTGSFAHGDAHSVSCYPLSTDRETVGIIEIVTEGPLDEAAQRTVDTMLTIFRNFQSLLDDRERDTLTGLLNRKTFDENFYKVVQEAAATGESRHGGLRKEPLHSVWLAMVDIDFFKAVNDRHGHLIGDEVLLLLSRLMRTSLRCHDRLYRFGGEEFVVVSPCDTQAHAAACFERLRKETEAFMFPQAGRLTISVGFTRIMPDDSPNSALERADRAMYHAKDNGRNQICCHGDLVASGHMTTLEKIGEIELF